jgi:hypothetical protein
LCAEGLSALIKKAESQGSLHGVRICTNAPIISHLLFTDDCFLFFKGSAAEAHVMKSILASYEVASGQAINFQKSEIFCSRNTPPEVRADITNIMGVRQVLGTGKYLGVPSIVGRSKSSTFKFIKDRMWSKINSWSSRCLSQAGREILIKSVLQSISSYLMSTFMLPNSLINEIEKMLNAFWWGHDNGSNRGMHWLSWECLTVPKGYGGMGFKSLKAVNMAMLGKQAWKILTHPESLITRLIKARYFPTSDYFAARSGHNPSYVWRSIWSVKSVMQNGFRWSIGTGTNISVWDPFGMRNGYSIPPPLEMNHAMANLKVADLLQLHTKQWHTENISILFDQNSMYQICRTPLLPSIQSDKAVWKFEKNRIYSVRSAYRNSMDRNLVVKQHRIN